MLSILLETTWNTDTEGRQITATSHNPLFLQAGKLPQTLHPARADAITH